jgi:hypothetical protein
VGRGKTPQTGASPHSWEVTARPDPLNPLDRRSVLRLGLLTGIAGLAGCSRSTSSSGAHLSTTGSGSPHPTSTSPPPASTTTPPVTSSSATTSRSAALPTPAPWVAGRGRCRAGPAGRRVSRALPGRWAGRPRWGWRAVLQRPVPRGPPAPRLPHLTGRSAVDRQQGVVRFLTQKGAVSKP